MSSNKLEAIKSILQSSGWQYIEEAIEQEKQALMDEEMSLAIKDKDDEFVGRQYKSIKMGQKMFDRFIRRINSYKANTKADTEKYI